MEIRIMDSIIILLVIIIGIIFLVACAAGVAIAVICIFKITEKIIEAIENFFNNL